MMNKSEFTAELTARLGSLREEDVKKSVEYYSEIIDDRIEEGMDETDAVAAVGEIDDIAMQIMHDLPLSTLIKAKAKHTRSLKTWETVLIIAGSPLWVPLLIAAAVTAFAIAVSAWSIVIALFSVLLSLGIGAVACVFGALYSLVTGFAVKGLLFFGCGLISAGLSVYIFYAAKAAAAALAKACAAAIRGIKSLIINKGEKL